jgi:hypothetical protein
VKLAIIFSVLLSALGFLGCMSPRHPQPPAPATDVLIRATPDRPVVQRSRPFRVTFSAQNLSKRTIQFHDLFVGDHHETNEGVGEWGVWHHALPADARWGAGVATEAQHAFTLAPGQTYRRTESFDLSDSDPTAPLGIYRVCCIFNDVAADRAVRIKIIPSSLTLRQ